MTAEDIDAQERAAFVKWRQELAKLEEEEGLVLTPFEKNLEVWRQLWRVLERSHTVVQVSHRATATATLHKMLPFIDKPPICIWLRAKTNFRCR